MDWKVSIWIRNKTKAADRRVYRWPTAFLEDFKQISDRKSEVLHFQEKNVDASSSV